jgi:hypothetical protein
MDLALNLMMAGIVFSRLTAVYKARVHDFTGCRSGPWGTLEN